MLHMMCLEGRGKVTIVRERSTYTDSHHAYFRQYPRVLLLSVRGKGGKRGHRSELLLEVSGFAEA